MVLLLRVASGDLLLLELVRIAALKVLRVDLAMLHLTLNFHRVVVMVKMTLRAVVRHRFALHDLLPVQTVSSTVSYLRVESKPRLLLERFATFELRVV